MTHRVTLIPGDWIGPEVSAVAQEVIRAAGVDIDWDVRNFRSEGVTDHFADVCRGSCVVLKGRTDPYRVGERMPVTVALRKKLGLWVTLRRARPLMGYPTRFRDFDLVVIRETSEDIYAGLEHEVTDGVYEAVKVTTRAACERIARFAYDYAVAHGRHKVTIVHKSNIMKMSDGLFLRTAERVGAEYADRGIETEEVIVDALCMRLVRRPSDFNVLLTANLFGDIVGDLCAGLAGGIVGGASVSLGDGGVAMFENAFGRAPELVGTGKANPIPMLQAANLMLRHLGEQDAADRIRDAVMAALADGLRTIDLGGDHGCADVRDAIIDRLRPG